MKRIFFLAVTGLAVAVTAFTLADIVLAQVVVPGTDISTTGPVNSQTTISLGTIAGEVLKYVISAFGVVIGTVLTAWLMKLVKIAGVDLTDKQKAQLQGIVVNGINAAAARTAERARGLGQVELKNAIVREAVQYTQVHGAEVMKSLGLDPEGGRAVEAIKARIETAIVDPITPTPPVLAPALGDPDDQRSTLTHTNNKPGGIPNPPPPRGA